MSNYEFAFGLLIAAVCKIYPQRNTQPVLRRYLEECWITVAALAG